MLTRLICSPTSLWL